MPQVTVQPTLLEELDARQNEVLQELDKLNDRIEDLIREFTKEKTQPVSPSRAA